MLLWGSILVGRDSPSSGFCQGGGAKAALWGAGEVQGKRGGKRGQP